MTDPISPELLESIEAESVASVLRFERPAESAEDLLRNALSECAEIRASGGEPYCVLVLGEPGQPVSVARSPLFTVQMVNAAKLLDIIAEDMIREDVGV